jgi:hypothetical protein
MANQEPAGNPAQPPKPSRKEQRLHIAAQIAAANYDTVMGPKAAGSLAERLERLLQDADSLIVANDQFHARMDAARKAGGHEKGNG